MDQAPVAAMDHQDLDSHQLMEEMVVPVGGAIHLKTATTTQTVDPHKMGVENVMGTTTSITKQMVAKKGYPRRYATVWNHH